MNKLKEVLGWVSKNAKLLMQALVYIVTISNSVLAFAGVELPFENQTIYTIVSLVLLLAVFVYGVWHNFSVSTEAKASDKVMKALKQGTLEMEQVKNLIETVTDGSTYEQTHSADNKEDK